MKPSCIAKWKAQKRNLNVHWKKQKLLEDRFFFFIFLQNISITRCTWFRVTTTVTRHKSKKINKLINKKDKKRYTFVSSLLQPKGKKCLKTCNKYMYTSDVHVFCIISKFLTFWIQESYRGGNTTCSLISCCSFQEPAWCTVYLESTKNQGF